MCYFIVLMSSLLFYNVEHSKKNKKNKPIVCPDIDWYCTSNHNTHIVQCMLMRKTRTIVKMVFIIHI